LVCNFFNPQIIISSEGKLYYNEIAKKNKHMSRTSRNEKGISLLVSVLFHLGLLFLLIELVPPVRLYLFRHAADVRIVDPETVFIPRIAGVATPVPLTPGSSSPQIFSEGPIARGTEDRQQLEANPGVVYLKNVSFGRDVGGATESFDLVPSSKSEGSFSLAISRKKPGNEEEERTGPDTHKDVDLSKYSAPAMSPFRFNRIVTNKGGGQSGLIDPEINDQQEGYDIAPWVKEVVDRIRNNWTPPPIGESMALGKVKILIVIGKQGHLVDMKIVESSDFHIFDQTTMAAIRSSTPFPPLPVDFPAERLEAFLVFEFHE
jgi:TonB family protein